MKYYRVKYVIPLSLTLFSVIISFGHTETSPSKSISKPAYFIGGNFLYNRRDGAYVFETFNKQQNIVLPKLSLFGVNMGKRYYTTPWLRFQLDILFNFGRSIEDTLYYGAYFARKYSYKNFDFLVDMHLVRPISGTLDLFVLSGGGLTYFHLEEQTMRPDDPKEEISISDYKGADIKRWSPCVQFGAGLDITPVKSMGFCFTYSYRIWKPVELIDARDMPLEGIEYRERFFSHVFQVKFLFNLTPE